MENQIQDVTVVNEGSIVLFTLETEAAKFWWDENVAETLEFGGNIFCKVVEWRYAAAIVEGLADAGFNVISR
jgi:hypothetical protein